MDKDGNKIVAFSFFCELEDWNDIKKAVEEERKQSWEKNKKKGETKPGKLHSENFCEIPPEKVDKYWRPSTSLALSLIKDNDIAIDEYHLLYQPNLPKHEKLQRDGAGYIKRAIERMMRKELEDRTSPPVSVVLDPIDIGSGHEFQAVYCSLYDYFEAYFKNLKNEPSQANKVRYLVHVTAGSQAARMCLFLLAQARWVPAECVQISKSRPSFHDEAAPREPNVGYCFVTNPIVSSEEYKEIRRHREKVVEDNKSILKQNIKTEDKNYNRIIAQIERVVTKTTDDPILLLGDTGVGKSHIAKAIHQIRQNSTKDEVPFIRFNCSGFQGSLVESILFGHAAGAFTDAKTPEEGLVERANGGILFLDEIGTLPWETQGKLLTLLDDHKFYRLGEYKTERKSNFQLICATNEDLPQLVENGKLKFRRDLLERIRMWTFTIPSLGERRADILPNIEKELENFSETYEHKVRLEGLPRNKFMTYINSIPLKGNFRELKRMVWRMATLAENGNIDMDLVEEEIKRHREETKQSAENDHPHPEKSAPSNDPTDSSNGLLDRLLSELLGANYKSKIDPIDLCQLRYVIDVCSKESSEAAASRELFKIRLGKGGNPNNPIRNFFNRKENKKFRLTFKGIKAAAEKLRSTTTLEFTP